MTDIDHSAGDTEPAEHVSNSIARLLRTQPVVAALLAIELPVVAGFVLALLDGGSLNTRDVILAVVTPLAPIVMAGVWKVVTPTAKPQIVAQGETIPLVPAAVTDLD